jgi:SAM-dependent methyltransferase
MALTSWLRARWRHLKSLQHESDLALLLTSPYFVQKKALRDAVRRATTWLGGPGTLVDLGCGYQPYRALFPDWRYVGIDFSAERRPTVVSRVEQVPVAEGVADLVLCTEVLEHTPEPSSVCEEIARITRAGGLVFVSAPMSWNLHYEPHDYYRFTHYGLSHRLASAGLDPIHAWRLGGLASLTGARWVDVIHRKLLRVPRMGTSGAGFAIATLVVAPLNVVALLFAKCLDWIDASDAVGWFVIARRPSHPTVQGVDMAELADDQALQRPHGTDVTRRNNDSTGVSDS